MSAQGQPHEKRPPSPRCPRQGTDEGGESAHRGIEAIELAEVTGGGALRPYPIGRPRCSEARPPRPPSGHANALVPAAPAITPMVIATIRGRAPRAADGEDQTALDEAPSGETTHDRHADAAVAQQPPVTGE